MPPVLYLCVARRSDGHILVKHSCVLPRAEAARAMVEDAARSPMWTAARGSVTRDVHPSLTLHALFGDSDSPVYVCVVAKGAGGPRIHPSPGDPASGLLGGDARGCGKGIGPPRSLFSVRRAAMFV